MYSCAGREKTEFENECCDSDECCDCEECCDCDECCNCDQCLTKCQLIYSDLIRSGQFLSALIRLAALNAKTAYRRLV